MWGGALVRLPRNREPERDARPVVRDGPQTAAMALDDRPADRQADAHAVALRRVKRVEQLVHVLPLEPDASVPHAQADLIAFAARAADDDLPRPVVDGTHRLRRVAEEIQDHLLELNAISHHWR